MHKLLQAADFICNTRMSNRRTGSMVGISYNRIRKYRKLINKKQLSWANIQAMSSAELERFLCSSERRLSLKAPPDMEHILLEPRLVMRDSTLVRAPAAKAEKMASPKKSKAPVAAAAVSAARKKSR